MVMIQAIERMKPINSAIFLFALGIFIFFFKSVPAGILASVAGLCNAYLAAEERYGFVVRTVARKIIYIVLCVIGAVMAVAGSVMVNLKTFLGYPGGYGIYGGILVAIGVCLLGLIAVFKK